jgi:hypothetical protein
VVARQERGSYTSGAMHTRAMISAVLLGLLLPPRLAAQEKAAGLDALAKRFGIEIDTRPEKLYPVETHFGKITGTIATQSAVENYAPILAAELARYPAAFLRKTKLVKIVLARRLKFAGQERAAIPDFQNNVLHLDVLQGNWNQIFQRTVIHHELFHVVDWRDDGKLYEDKDWKKLNPPRFRYGKGGKSARGNDQWPLDSSLKGFLNKYSMSGVEEDKAEIYANLMVRPNVVRRRARKDSVLAKKITAMKRLLYAFSRSMDRNFWIGLER